MSKNLSLDIKTAYQISLVLFGILASGLVMINIVSVFQLFGKSETPPYAKIREQQLMQSIQFVETPLP